MTDDVAILGAGGLARETLDSVRANARWAFSGLVSPEKPDEALLKRIGAHWLGDDDVYLRSPLSQYFIVALGEPPLRRKVVERYRSASLTATGIAHPTSLVGSDVEVSEGCILGALCCVTTNVRVGEFSIIDRSVNVGHDVRIGSYVTVHPGATISGNVEIEDRVILGAGSTVLPGRHIGAGSTIGAGAVVTRDVPPGRTFAGVPARDLHA